VNCGYPGLYDGLGWCVYDLFYCLRIVAERAVVLYFEVIMTKMRSVIWDWRLVRAGSFRLDGGSMFGIIPKNLWSRVIDCDEQNRILLQTNCLLLDDHEGRKVLIETGYGDKFDEKSRSIFGMEERCIVDALGEIDVDPGEVTDVILTHLHFDHAAGLTGKAKVEGGDLRNNFPNAVIYVQKREWLDALANKSTMTRTYLREHLEPVREQVELVEGEGEVVPGIGVLPAPGHTWGQQAVLFGDDEGMVVFPGDVMPTVHHLGLAYNMGYDVEPYTNMQTKSRLLARACDEGWRWVIDHEAGDAIVRIVADDARPGSYRTDHV